MTYRHLLSIALLGLSLPMMAQTADDVKSEINRVKKSSQYIYADMTAATEQDARDAAESMLYNEINQWAATQKKLRGKENFIVNNKKEVWTTLSSTRGNMFRSFIYVKKSDIQGSDGFDVVKNTQREQTMPQSTVEEIGVDSSVLPQGYPAVVTELTAITGYQDFAARLMQLKREDRIKNYQRYEKGKDFSSSYLAIYNKEGKMAAILTPGTTRQNVATGAADSETNYPGHGALAFTLNE